jgi:hypothetical protein
VRFIKLGRGDRRMNKWAYLLVIGQLRIEIMWMDM